MSDEQDDTYEEDDDIDIPTEFLDKVRLAFYMLEESKVIDDGKGEYVLLRVNRSEYEEFLSPSSLFVIH
tara:strand:+ start:122 stop:328 length:207 start_codon:yes stop_codon:yes gene_type:complete